MKIILIAFLILVLGCSRAKNYAAPHSVTSDTLHFSQLFPLGLFQYKQVHGSNMLYCYNKNSILVYDIDKKETITTIPLADTSHDNKLRSFYVHNTDSIFVQRMYSLSMLDSTGAVKYRKIINGPGLDEWPPLVYNNYGNVFPMYFANKTIYTRQYSGSYENYKKSFFTVKIEAAFSLSDSSFKELPVQYPDNYHHHFYGEADLAFREADDSCNLYSFMASPEIVTYNRFTGQLKRYNGAGRSVSGEFMPLDLQYKEDMNRKVDHLLENPLHMKIIFDPYKNIYYRFLLNGKPLKNKDGTYNEFGDKDLVISVFDRQFNLMCELNAGSNYLWFFSFATPKGLYLLRETDSITSHQTTVDGKSFIFDVFAFDCNQ